MTSLLNQEIIFRGERHRRRHTRVQSWL